MPQDAEECGPRPCFVSLGVPAEDLVPRGGTVRTEKVHELLSPIKQGLYSDGWSRSHLDKRDCLSIFIHYINYKTSSLLDLK